MLFPEWLAKLFSWQNSCFLHQRTRVGNRILVWHADASACGSRAALQALHMTRGAAAHLWLRDYEFSIQQFLDNLYLKLKLFLWWSVTRTTTKKNQMIISPSRSQKKNCTGSKFHIFRSWQTFLGANHKKMFSHSPQQQLHCSALCRYPWQRSTLCWSRYRSQWQQAWKWRSTRADF